jgi:hypothetical protein
MRARAAYIRSLGTTGILLLAAILLLGVVGALVGFHRWPDGAVGQTVPTVPVKPSQEGRLRLVRSESAQRVSTQDLVKASPRASTAGLVKVVPVSTPGSGGTPLAVTPGHVAPGTPPADAAPPRAHASHPGGSDQHVTPTDPAPDVDPQSLQQVVDQLIASVPVDPVPPERGQPVAVHVPLVGATISTPPLP